MKTEGIKKWLRDNSSGVYRPAREAADLIDQLERKLNAATDELDDIREVLLHGADESLWPPGMTLAQSIRKIITRCKMPNEPQKPSRTTDSANRGRLRRLVRHQENDQHK